MSRTFFARLAVVTSIVGVVSVAGLILGGQELPLDPNNAVVNPGRPSEGLQIQRRDRDGHARFAAAAGACG